MPACSPASSRRCPPTTIIPIAPARGVPTSPSGTSATATSSASCLPTSTASTCATRRIRCTRRSAAITRSTATACSTPSSSATATATYRNRFVRTAGFEAELAAGGPLWAGLAEPPSRSLRDGWGARTRMKDASSTDVVVHAGRALTSFYQCGDLYAQRPADARAARRRAAGTGGSRRRGVGTPQGRPGHRRAALLQLLDHGAVPPLRGRRRRPATSSTTRRSSYPGRASRTTWRSPRTSPSSTTARCSGTPTCSARGVHAVRFYPELPTRIGVLPRRGNERGHPLVRSLPHLRTALDQRLRGRRRGRRRRVLRAQPGGDRATRRRRDHLVGTTPSGGCSGSSTPPRSIRSPTAGASICAPGRSRRRSCRTP